MRKLFLAAAMAAFAVSACSQEGVFEEGSPLVEVGEKILIVSPEAAMDTVWVRANRSWTVKAQGEEDWISVENPENLNLSKSTMLTPLVFKVDENLVKASRQAVFSIVSETGTKSLTVVQQEMVYKLSVTTPTTYDEVEDLGEMVTVKIQSNAPWKAKVKSGGTISFLLGSTSGTGSYDLHVTVMQNTDQVNGKTGSIILSAPECEDIEITFNQKNAAPYARRQLPDANRFVDPDVFSALPSTRSFTVIANCKWTVAVSPESTATGIELPRTSGNGRMDNFIVKVNDTNLDMDNRKTVVLVFSPEGGSQYTLRMEQEKGSILALEFKDQDNTKSQWIFDEPVPSSIPAKGYFHIGGYAFGYEGTNYCQLHSSGWQLGSNPDNYVEFPAIPGKKLVRVTFVEFNASPMPSIVTTAGVTVDGGETITYSKLAPTTFNLRETEENTAYRMIVGTNKTFRFSHLEIEYE